MTTATQTVDPVEAAIQAAQAAAANPTILEHNPNPTSTGVATQTASTAVSADLAPLPSGKPLGMEDLMTGMAVDAWLKVKQYGLLISKDKVDTGLIPKLKVKLNAIQGKGFVPKKCIKFGGGSSAARYHHTFDEVTAENGQSWAQACAEARAITPTASPYASCDIIVTLMEDAGGIPAGTTLGHTLATTNFAEWKKAYQQLVDGEFIGEEVILELGFKERTNANKQSWGIITFKVEGLADAGE